jgi:hypothetical protein
LRQTSGEDPGDRETLKVIEEAEAVITEYRKSPYLQREENRKW